jgi:hypothetical protein
MEEVADKIITLVLTATSICKSKSVKQNKSKQNPKEQNL